MPALPHPTVHAAAAATEAAKVRVLVTDALGLQRVLTMLTGRGHAFLRLEAEEAAGGRWTIGFDVMAASTRLELVTARLHRLPCVLSVDVTTAELAPSA
jgi:acetolactate synthase regulatory subunit